MNQNRRKFLTALTGAVAVTTPVAASVVKPDAASGLTDQCARDRHDRAVMAGQNHDLARRAYVSLDNLDNALLDLEVSRDEFDDLAADCHGLRHVVRLGAVSIWSCARPDDDFGPVAGRVARPTAKGVTPHERCCLALHDALDALLDATAGHCKDQDCFVCLDSDATVYHVNVGIDTIGDAELATVAVAKRALLSARRKVARQFRRDMTSLPQSVRLHDSPEHEVEWCRQLLALAQHRK